MQQLARHRFITHRYDDLPEGDRELQEGALRDLVAHEFDRARIGDGALVEKYVRLTVDPITVFIKQLLDEQLTDDGGGNSAPLVGEEGAKKSKTPVTSTPTTYPSSIRSVANFDKISRVERLR